MAVMQHMAKLKMAIPPVAIALYHKENLHTYNDALGNNNSGKYLYIK